MSDEKTIGREALVQTICDNSDGVSPSEITGDIDFADIPMDSLDIMSAFQGVEEEFGASIPDEDMHTLHNLNDLIGYLQKQCYTIS